MPRVAHMLENVKDSLMGARPLPRAMGVGMEMSREQCRAGRALLKWTQPQLAKAAGVATSTLVNFELGTRRNVGYEKILKIRVALELAGVTFNGNGGVTLRRRR